MHKQHRHIVDMCQKLKEQAEQTALQIGRLSEPPLQEHLSAQLLRDILVEHGFAIEREFSHMPTAFTASRGKGKPVVGLLAEYDALPGCGEDCSGFGHGCGHNLLGTAAVFAAIAAAGALEKEGIKGTVKLLGCPAEETLVGKVYMARDGAFDDLSACLAWHPSAGTRANDASGLAMDSLVYEFTGKTAHAACDPHHGRSALDAVEIMNIAVNYLREHVPPDVRIHYVIRHGGEAPNVVPPYARVWYYVRGKNREVVNEVRERVHNCARAAALATDTQMKMTFLAACYDRLPNSAISNQIDANLKEVGAPQFDAHDDEFVRSLGLTQPLSRETGEIATGTSSGSSDEGNVSWITPLGRLDVACWAPGTPGHNTLVHRQAISSVGMKGLAVATQVLALTAFDLCTDPALLRRIRREFRTRLGTQSYAPVIPQEQPAPVADGENLRS